MCHEIQGQTYTSKLDHFFWNEGLSYKIKDAGVFNSPDNLSDHCPVYCVIKYENNGLNPNELFHPAGTLKPYWKKASSEKKSVSRPT